METRQSWVEEGSFDSSEVSSVVGSHLSLNQGTNLNLSGGKLMLSERAGEWAQHPHRRAGPAAPQVSPVA